jgi:hypothetical protein
LSSVLPGELSFTSFSLFVCRGLTWTILTVFPSDNGRGARRRGRWTRSRPRPRYR